MLSLIPCGFLHAIYWPPKATNPKLEVGVSWLTNLFNFPRSQKRPQVPCILVDWFVSQCVMRLLAQYAFDFQQWIALNSLDIEVNVCPRKISKPCSCTSKSKLANLKTILCKAIQGCNYVQVSPKISWSFCYMQYTYYKEQKNINEYMDFAKKDESKHPQHP